MVTVALRSSSGFTATLAVREAGPLGAPKPRLLDRVREAIRTRHYSRYIFFHGKRHPAEMGARPTQPDNAVQVISS